MSSIDSLFDQRLQQLRAVRMAILRLHKALLDTEKIVYEQFHGRIRNNVEYFQLVLNHEWFSWLRPISKFVAQVDDALAAKEPITIVQIESFLSEARSLLRPNETGTPQEKRYFRAIQRNPDIAMMHAEVSRLLVEADPG